MYNLYDRIAFLCEKKGVTAGKMCSSTGISRGLITDLKMGRKQSPTGETLQKIATYFNVSVDYLLSNENKPAAQSDELIKDEFISFYGEVKKELTDEDIEDIKLFMQMKAEIKKKRKGG